MAKVEVTEKNKRKLIKYSQELFEQMRGDNDYPYTKWEEQFDECYRMYAAGNMSQKFLDFAVGGKHSNATDLG